MRNIRVQESCVGKLRLVGRRTPSLEACSKSVCPLICDGFGTHETLEVLEFCLANNIILCRLPSHTSHKLQPCDVGPLAPLKTAYSDEVDRLNRGGVDTIQLAKSMLRICTVLQGKGR
jgi:hypothetical protein